MGEIQQRSAGVVRADLMSTSEIEWYRWTGTTLTRVLLSLATAILLICSLPGPDVGWLAWVALVPLILACHGVNPGPAAGLGLLSGVVASFGIYGWLFEVPSFDLRHAVILALYVAIYPAMWCAVLVLVQRRHRSLLLSVPIVWVAVDYLRAHAGFLALPWGTLAQTQHRNLPLLQVASLGGEYAVTFLVALGNAAVASLLLASERRKSLIAVVGVLTLAHLWGVSVLMASPQGTPIRIAVVQPNIQIAERITAAGRGAILDRLERLTHVASRDHPDLVVWPESALPVDLPADHAVLSRVQSLSDQVGIPLVVGAAQVEKFVTGEATVTIGPRFFNTAYFVRPGTPLAEPYKKRVLVPFAEYLPHAGTIPWPAWLAPHVVDTTPGDLAELFNLSPTVTIGTLICWENLFPSLARESVGSGAQLLVQLTNDVWFGRSAASRQHNLMSVLRAVENHIPIVIASNSGPSQIIDRYGRVLVQIPELFTEGLATQEVRPGTHGTVYTVMGDWLPISALISLCAVGLWPRLRQTIVRTQPSFAWRRERTRPMLAPKSESGA